MNSKNHQKNDKKVQILVDKPNQRCYNSSMEIRNTYKNLTRICGGNITPATLKLVLADIEFQTTAVKQEFWQYMIEMGETFGAIQSFVVQDRELSKEKIYE
jgi:hypothetical protein